MFRISPTTSEQSLCVSTHSHLTWGNQFFDSLVAHVLKKDALQSTVVFTEDDKVDRAISVQNYSGFLRFSVVFLSFERILWNSQRWSKASFRKASTELVFPQNRRGHCPVRSQFLWVHCPDMNKKGSSQITGCPMGVPSVNSNRMCSSFKMFARSLLF